MTSSEKYGECLVCHGPYERFDSPTGLFYSHFDHPSDEHDVQVLAVDDFTEDGIWDAYRLAFITNKQKLGSNGDTAHVAGLMAVYELGYARRVDDE